MKESLKIEIEEIGNYRIPSIILDQGSWHSHLYFAFFIIRYFKPRRLVELGSYRGTSFRGFLEASKQSGWRIEANAVDCWEGDAHAGFYGEEVYRRFIESLTPYQESAELFVRKMRFDQALSLFEAGTVDLLHIDGLHTYEAVKEDFEKWLPKMSKTGVILFHDIVVKKEDFGVWRFWEEIKERYPSFQFNFCNGLGVLIVHTDKSTGWQEFQESFLKNPSIHEKFRVYGELLRLNYNQTSLKNSLLEMQAQESYFLKEGIRIKKTPWTQWLARIFKLTFFLCLLLINP